MCFILNMRSFNKIPLSAASVAALLVCSSARATVFTFDIAGLTDFQDVDQTYGDNVTSATMGAFSYGSAEGFTPNVTVAYGNTMPALWTTGYGNLSNVLFEDEDGTGVLNITLTAAPGFFVSLHSFDLATYTTTFGADPTIASVKVFDSTDTAVFTLSNPVISRTTRTMLTFGPLSDTALRIEVDARNLGNNNDDISVDNITISQYTAVPEPATLVWAGSALALFALARRRGLLVRNG